MENSEDSEILEISKFSTDCEYKEPVKPTEYTIEAITKYLIASHYYLQHIYVPKNDYELLEKYKYVVDVVECFDRVNLLKQDFPIQLEWMRIFTEINKVVIKLENSIECKDFIKQLDAATTRQELQKIWECYCDFIMCDNIENNEECFDKFRTTWVRLQFK